LALSHWAKLLKNSVDVMFIVDSLTNLGPL